MKRLFSSLLRNLLTECNSNLKVLKNCRKPMKPFHMRYLLLKLHIIKSINIIAFIYAYYSNKTSYDKQNVSILNHYT